jgi:hypothetical protein
VLPEDAPVATRFGGEAEPRLRLRDDDGSQPFSRCSRCHFDNVKTDHLCGHCGADLTTIGQVTFNQEFWKQHLEETAEQERAASRYRRADAALPAASDPLYREALREEAARRRSLLDKVGPRVGRWLAAKIPDPRLRWALLGTVAAGFLWLAFWSVGRWGNRPEVFLLVWMLALGVRLAAHRPAR